MTANKKTAWINAFRNSSAKGFNFFYLTRIAPFGHIKERTDQQPPHIAAQLVPFFRDFQAPACPEFVEGSQRLKPKACKSVAMSLSN